MLVPVYPQFRKRDDRKPRPRRQATPPGPLTLVSASYSHATPQFLVLEFNQAIDISAMDGSAMQVIDNQYNSTIYDATGAASLLTPTTLKVILTAIDTAIDVGVFLYTIAPSGIVAVDGGGTWVGVDEGLELPFP